MKINPTEDGGRIIAGDTPYGSWRIVVSPKGKITRESTFSFDEPKPVAKVVNYAQNVAKHGTDIVLAADEAVIRARLAVCSDCEHFDPTRFLCRECGCGWKPKLTTKANTCPKDKWNG